MRTFEVYKHRTKSGAHFYEAVKKGFSWPGFFFSVIWAFLNELWLLGIAGIAILPFTRKIHDFFYNEGNTTLAVGALLLQATYLFLSGAMTNKWRSRLLIRKGLQHIGNIVAETPDAAIEAIQREDKIEEKKSN